MKEPSTIRVLLVEDHAFTRDGLRVAINFEPELRVVGEARSGEEALEVLAARGANAGMGGEVPDVVVLDIGLPGIDGIETAARIKRLYPALRVVMLTAHNLRGEVLAAMGSAADTYCLKSAEPELLPLAIWAAASGSAYLDPQIAHHILGSVRAHAERLAAHRA
ncbi:response regulator [Deinococcus alpinitundrae]|uniref:response regulator n=1 Tax=Deinococcus alpinitundrae TaxID=468913 RepID=UPI0027B950CF|nr:response regulator transcription factor [Deinococcus alpinitundrae]